MGKNRRPLIALMATLIAIGGFGFVLSSCSSSGTSASSATTENSKESETTDEEPSWLLTQTAKFGSMTPNADGTYQLVLGGVDPQVTAFTDRPYRDTGVLSISQLTNGWSTTFADSAPNGVLVTHRPGSPADSITVELFTPQFNGSTMTYTVRVLADEYNPERIVGDTTAATAPIPPATFALASLFIDSVGLRYACLSEDGSQDEIYPPGDVPSTGVTKAWRDQCIAAGGGIGETFG